MSQASIDRLVLALDRAYMHPWRMMGRSFLHGLLTALGATIGAALFFSIALWLFQALGGISLIKPYVEKVQELVIPSELRATPTGADHS